MLKNNKMTFEQATARYVHRFTMEYVPDWALRPGPDGKYPAPQFTSDHEWYENTIFPPNHPLGRRVKDCYTNGQTWPLGKSLDKPYSR